MKKTTCKDSQNSIYDFPDDRAYVQNIQRRESVPLNGAGCIEPVFTLTIRSEKVDLDGLLSEHLSVKNIIVKFPCLYVYPSHIPNSGLGLFAYRDIPKGVLIPYMGRLECVRNIENKQYAMWAGTDLAWNASPMLDPLRKFASNKNMGTFICGRVNEANTSMGMPPNVCIKRGERFASEDVLRGSDVSSGCKVYQMYYITTKDIKCGDELLTRYNRNS